MQRQFIADADLAQMLIYWCDAVGWLLMLTISIYQVDSCLAPTCKWLMRAYWFRHNLQFQTKFAAASWCWLSPGDSHLFVDNFKQIHLIFKFSSWCWFIYWLWLFASVAASNLADITVFAATISSWCNLLFVAASAVGPYGPELQFI